MMMMMMMMMNILAVAEIFWGHEAAVAARAQAARGTSQEPLKNLRRTFEESSKNLRRLTSSSSYRKTYKNRYFE